MIEKTIKHQQKINIDIDLDLDNNEALIKKGLLFKSQKKYQEAIFCFKKILKENPLHIGTLNNLGGTYKEMGKTLDAERLFYQVLEFQPDYLPAHANLALIYLEKKEYQAAIEHSNKAYKTFQNNPDFLFNFALILERINDFPKAIKLYEKAISINPNHYKSYINVSALKILIGDLINAEEYLSNCVKRFPNNYRVLNNIGLCYEEQGKIKQAFEFYKKAALAEQTENIAKSNLLFAMHYQPCINGEILYQMHCQWANFLEKECYDFENVYKNDQKINIGYLSPDFRVHPVATFLYPILLNHNRKFFRIICYSQVVHQDDMTERIKKQCTKWVDITSLTDKEACSSIQRDQIHILVDLAGYSKNNRINIFAMKPAPVQISYLGYPGTTGLKQIDYRLTDKWADPQEHNSLHTEKLIRMPHCFLCYEPGEAMPEVSSLPALKNSFITLGSFNRMSKLNDNILEVWAKIMVRQKNTLLILKAQAFHDPLVKKRIINFFENIGVKRNRLILLERLNSRMEHLKLYNKIDIALDTFPYHGTATTCQALWMGVPVVTLQGNAHVSRVSVSILKTIGLSDCVALSKKEYIDKVCNIANNIDLLSCLRKNLRKLIQDSPLYQSKKFVLQLEQQYQKLWQKYLMNKKIQIKY